MFREIDNASILKGQAEVEYEINLQLFIIESHLNFPFQILKSLLAQLPNCELLLINAFKCGKEQDYQYS